VPTDAIDVQRHLPFETVFNFRDLGGYEGTGGRTVRWRTVFRADGLHRMGADELAGFGELGIKTVVDLRTPGELEERGRFSAADVGARYQHLPVLETVWNGDLFDAGVPAADFLAARYLEMIEVGQAALGGALTLVADPDSLPLVFHCAAGKDRTGVLAAIVLGLLGVDDAVIAHDYSLSGLGMTRFRAWFEATFPEAVERMANQPDAFMDAPEEAMQRFLTGVRDRHGSIRDYVAEIGVPDAVVGELQANLLE